MLSRISRTTRSSRRSSGAREAATFTGALFLGFLVSGHLGSIVTSLTSCTVSSRHAIHSNQDLLCLEAADSQLLVHLLANMHGLLVDEGKSHTDGKYRKGGKAHSCMSYQTVSLKRLQLGKRRLLI